MRGIRQIRFFSRIFNDPTAACSLSSLKIGNSGDRPNSPLTESTRHWRQASAFIFPWHIFPDPRTHFQKYALIGSTANPQIWICIFQKVKMYNFHVFRGKTYSHRKLSNLVSLFTLTIKTLIDYTHTKSKICCIYCTSI